MPSVNQRIIGAVTPVVPVCVPEPYVPVVDEMPERYCTFQYTQSPDCFGDDAPETLRYSIQLHFFAPRHPAGGSSNTLSIRKALCRAIFSQGFTYPVVEDASDGDGQHFVFEFEDCDGEV